MLPHSVSLRPFFGTAVSHFSPGVESSRFAPAKPTTHCLTSLALLFEQWVEYTVLGASSVAEPGTLIFYRDKRARCTQGVVFTDLIVAYWPVLSRAAYFDRGYTTGMGHWGRPYCRSIAFHWLLGGGQLRIPIQRPSSGLLLLHQIVQL